MALYSSGLKTHPYIGLTIEDLIRVRNYPENVIEILRRTNNGESCVARVPTESWPRHTTPKEGLFLEVPQLGDLVYIDTPFLILDGEDDYFPVKQTSSPVPLHFHYKVLIPADTSSIDFVWLRGPDREVVQAWCRDVTGSIKMNFRN